MFILPSSSHKLIGLLPIPKDLRELPAHDLLRAVVSLTSDYRSIVPDLHKQHIWTAHKQLLAERRQKLGIVEFCNRLHENEEYPIRTIFHLSFFKDFQEEVIEYAKEIGYGDLILQKVEEANPDRLREFTNLFLTGPFKDFCDEVCREFDDWERVEAEARHFWEAEFPTLPLQEQQVVMKDAGILNGFLFHIFSNIISVMSNSESLSSLFRRAIAGGLDADEAMCRAVRVDDNLRQHPYFLDRYLRATRDGDTSFLLKYNNTSSPFTYKVRYPGLYFLFGLLDCFGLLDRLTNTQVMDLCDHARLDRWESRIEDAGYMGKRRNEYQRRKFLQLSMH